jgi:C_GCAxxG_C_C family probable redox protein
MVIGLKYGKTRADDEQTKEKAYALFQNFVQEFKTRNGSIVCRELLGCDISTPKGKKLAEEKQLFTLLCPQFVQDAATIIEEILF